MSTEPISGVPPFDPSFEGYSSQKLGGFHTTNIVPTRISLAARAEAMNREFQQLDVDGIESINIALTELDKKDLENTQEFVKACETQKTWYSKYLFSSIVTALSSMLTASFLYADNMIQGIQMGIGGGLQLFNILMDNQNGWESVAKSVSGGNKEIEANIRAGLPFATNLLILALTTYSFFTIPTDHKSLMAIINQFMAYLNMSLGSVAMVVLYKKNVAEQKLFAGQNQRFEYSQQNEISSQEFEFHVESTRKTAQADKKTTELYIQATSRTAARTA